MCAFVRSSRAGISVKAWHRDRSDCRGGEGQGRPQHGAARRLARGAREGRSPSQLVPSVSRSESMCAFVRSPGRGAHRHVSRPYCSTQTGSISTAKTRRAWRASSAVRMPLPAPISSTRSPRPTFACRTSWAGDGATSEEVLAVRATVGVAERAGAARTHGRPARTSWWNRHRTGTWQAPDPGAAE